MKKVLILTVIAVLALGLASFAVTLNSNGTLTHVATGTTGTSLSVQSNFAVYQWYDYMLSAPSGVQAIKNSGQATLTLVNLSVSSNAPLNITYTDGVNGPDANAWADALNNGTPYWTDTNDSAHQLAGLASTNPSEGSFTVTPSSTTANMTDVSLHWTGNIPYALQAGSYWIRIVVKISPTITF